MLKLTYKAIARMAGYRVEYSGYTYSYYDSYSEFMHRCGRYATEDEAYKACCEDCGLVEGGVMSITKQQAEKLLSLVQALRAADEEVEIQLSLCGAYTIGYRSAKIAQEQALDAWLVAVRELREWD